MAGDLLSALAGVPIPALSFLLVALSAIVMFGACCRSRGMSTACVPPAAGPRDRRWVPSSCGSDLLDAREGPPWPERPRPLSRGRATAIWQPFKGIRGLTQHQVRGIVLCGCCVRVIRPRTRGSRWCALGSTAATTRCGSRSGWQVCTTAVCSGSSPGGDDVCGTTRSTTRYSQHHSPARLCSITRTSRSWGSSVGASGCPASAACKVSAASHVATACISSLPARDGCHAFLHTHVRSHSLSLARAQLASVLVLLTGAEWCRSVGAALRALPSACVSLTPFGALRLLCGELSGRRCTV